MTTVPAGYSTAFPLTVTTTTAVGGSTTTPVPVTGTDYVVRLYLTGTLAECIDADVEFHQTIAEASHNVLLGHLTASLMRVIHGHVSGNLEHLHGRAQGWEDLQSQHRAIWQAVRRHQPQQAALAASAHIEFVRENIENNALTEQRRQSALRRASGSA